MKIFKCLSDLHSEISTSQKNVFVTIGNFDGVHMGHREFLKIVREKAQKDNAYFLVITFVPHPLQILKAMKGFLINTYQEKAELLSSVGVDFVLEIDFTRDFSTLSPEAFLNDYVLKIKNLKEIFLGHDFAFGANKSGDFKIAKDICESKEILLTLQSEYRVSGSAVSSSVVRSEIQKGEMEKVASMLGRTYFLSGRVIKGEGRGKKIGFPTANLGYDQGLIIPGVGVYVTHTVVDNMRFHSVTNVGYNPTFNTGYEVHVETHLLDFAQDIYGESIKVEFVRKIRDEKKFSNVNDLIKQIEHDAQFARNFFKK
jgi:riboflavin kinase/FMN adenylyltransferase